MNATSLLRLLRRRLVRLCLYLLGTLLTVLATIIIGFAVQARLRLPDLEPWHQLQLAEEFRENATNAPRSFADYLALETRLFDEVRTRLSGTAAAASWGPSNRFNPQSTPGQLAGGAHNNRSYELLPEQPAGAVLLVHGLSDSPYSMRALADWYHARGFYVLSLRLPGHGTIPSGLLDVRWQDWFAAVRLAAEHTKARAGGGPFHVCGYSTGAALLALLAVRGLGDATLPHPDRLVMLSAAIGVSRFAAIANVASTLGCVPYFEKARWLDVLPEYDPYKYNSFPVNAGTQIHRLTMALRDELLQHGAQLDKMPKVLAFQSVIDSTVSAADLVREFLLRLPQGGHELVAFDINRSDGWTALIAPAERESLARIQAAQALPFKLTLVTNAKEGTSKVSALVRLAGSRETQTEATELAWPPLVFSLGHVALPFRSDDATYGLQPRDDGPLRWPLGQNVPRGEAGANTIPFASLARLRCNPFFALIEARLASALEQDRR